MFAIISWSTKNGISLDQEQLEVLGSGKFVVMNGGLLEPEAAVSMLYKKEMWGGIIQSVHGIKILFNIFLKVVPFTMYSGHINIKSSKCCRLLS